MHLIRVNTWLVFAYLLNPPHPVTGRFKFVLQQDIYISQTSPFITQKGTSLGNKDEYELFLHVRKFLINLLTTYNIEYVIDFIEEYVDCTIP